MKEKKSIIIVLIAIFITVLMVFGYIVFVSGDLPIQYNENNENSQNLKFEKYEGNDVKGSDVLKLCKETADFNKQNLENKDENVEIIYDHISPFDADFPDNNIVNKKGEYGVKYNLISSAKSYEVKCQYNDKEFVDSIIIKENQGKGEGLIIATFNEQFEKYEGTDVRGTNVKVLCKSVENHNTNQTENNKKIRVGLADKQKNSARFSENDLDNLVNDKGEYGEKFNEILPAKKYSVKCYYNDSGEVRSIIIVANGTKEN